MRPYRVANAVTVTEFGTEERDTLLDQGSLTERLIAASEKSFAVEVLSQGFAKPRIDEAMALKIRPQSQCLIREVKLVVDDVPWVYARSIVPMHSLKGQLGFLKKLKNSALGALLFKDPGLKRSEFEIFEGKLSDLVSDLVGLGLQEQSVLSRRSVFKLKNQPLLVAETFLADCLL